MLLLFYQKNPQKLKKTSAFLSSYSNKIKNCGFDRFCYRILVSRSSLSRVYQELPAVEIIICLTSYSPAPAAGEKEIPWLPLNGPRESAAQPRGQPLPPQTFPRVSSAQGPQGISCPGIRVLADCPVMTTNMDPHFIVRSSPSNLQPVSFQDLWNF